MKKALVLLLLAGAFVFAISAEASTDAPVDVDAPAITPAKSFPSSVGVFGTSVLGGGLSYQIWFDRFGCALTVGGGAEPYTTAGSIDLVNNPTGSPDFYAWNYNVELDCMYRLYSSVFSNWLTGDLFAYGTVAHMGTTKAVYVNNADLTKQGSYVEGEFVPVVAAGIGVGYEVILFKHFSIPVQFGYMAQWPFRVDFTASGGLRYRF
jgi:hypothetical protein